MPTSRIRLTAYAGLAAVFAMAAAISQGASITAGGTDHLVAGDVNDPYVISVNTNHSGYANAFSDASNAAYVGLSTNKSFNGPIEGYHFVRVTGGSGARYITTSAESGGIVSKMTSTEEAVTNGFDSFGQNVQGFDVTDPGSDLIAAEALTRDFNAGIRDLDDFSGTVDISGLTEGSIYVFYGRYHNGSLSLTASMKDSVLPDIPSGELFGGVTLVSKHNIVATRIDFVNDSGYDSIDYAVTGGSLRLVGAVVTSPEPPPRAGTLLYGN